MSRLEQIKESWSTKKKTEYGTIEIDSGEAGSLLAMLDIALKALDHCKEYENKSRCNYCGGGISEIIEPAIRMITQ